MAEPESRMLFYFILRFAIIGCKGNDIADTIEPREESKSLVLAARTLRERP